MSAFQLSLVLILLAGMFQGTFGLGMKKFAPLSWEAFWLIFAVVGMVIIPWVWASIVVPDVWAAIRAVPSNDMYVSILLGACWGVGALMFGLAITYIGISLAYGITMSLAAAMGSLIPLFALENITTDPAVPWIIAGIVIMVIGVVFLTYAGILRDVAQATLGRAVAGIRQGRMFYVGLLFTVINGVAAALLNVGFTKAQAAAKAAELQGAVTRNASLVAWIIVLTGGVVVNVAYCLFLLLKSKSYRTYTQPRAGRGIISALVTAMLWFAALGVYGQGAAIMGKLGPVIGWSMFLALALIVSSLWGLKDGEWKGMRTPLRVLLIGDGILVLSWIILGYANSIRPAA
jgi:L-rhamnose-H+ transport protein